MTISNYVHMKCNLAYEIWRKYEMYSKKVQKTEGKTDNKTKTIGSHSLVNIAILKWK